MRNFGRFGIFGLAAVALTGPAWATSTETVLFSFNGGRSGAEPQANVIRDRGGNLFGTTYGGGVNCNGIGCGTVYELKAGVSGKNGYVEKVIYRFQGPSHDGDHPWAALIEDANGALYGTTEGGPSVTGGGTVFKLSPPEAGQTNWTETILYAFPASLASIPVGSLIFDKSGALYGTAVNENGLVYKLSPPTEGQSNWVESTLYSFKGGTDGNTPQSALLMDETGALYGTTYAGGGDIMCNGVIGCGTVFKLRPPARGRTAWKETILYAFTGGTDGSVPAGGLVRDKSHALYGNVTYGGITGYGATFKLTPPAKGETGWTESVLYSFQGTPDGGNPMGNLTFGKQGNLYGTCFLDGSGGAGTVFELSPPPAGQTAWSENILYSFPNSGVDGALPTAGVLRDATGTVFGTTSNGGASSSSHGTVFELTP
jgi:hypothetical protein